MIARDDAPPFGETSLKIAIDKEVNTFIGRLGALGYAVDVASENGKDISAGGSTLTVDKKHAEAKITHRVCVIIPCMVQGNVPTSAVKIAQDMPSRNMPAAALNGGVLILAGAGVLEGRNYAIGQNLQPYVHDGDLKGIRVVRDGDIVTSGVCPFSAQVSGLKDGTDELVTAFAAMLKT